MDLDRHGDVVDVAVLAARLDADDVGVDVGDALADLGQQPLAVLHRQRQVDAVAPGLGAPVPLDLDPAVLRVEEVRHVRAVRRVDRHPLAARDVADDLLPLDRVAAPGPHHQHVVGAPHLDAVAAARQGPPDGGDDARGGLLQLVGRHELVEHLAGLQAAKPDGGEHLLDLLAARGRGRLLKGRVVEQRLRVQVEAADLLLEQAAPEVDGPGLLLPLQVVLDLVPGAGGDDEVEPVTARLVPGLRDDLDDVAILERGAQRHHAAVHARAHALVADVGVDRVGEVDGGGAPGQRLDLALGREGVDLLGVEVDLQVLDELLRVADLLLPLEQLAQPDEVGLVARGPDPPLLVLPVRGNPLLGVQVHLLGADLHLEGEPVVADDRGVQRLVAVGPRHRDEVLDPPGHGRPGLVDDAEGRVAVLHRPGDDAQRDEVVDAVEVDLLPAELEVDAVEALGPPRNLDDGDLGLLELGDDRLPQLLDDPLARLPALLDPVAERLVRLRLEVAERQLLQLVLDLRHAEPVGDRRVDVERLLCDAQAPVLGQEQQRTHVVQPVGELDQDDPDVVDHRQQHLAEVLGLALLARGEADGADLGHPLDDVGHLGAEHRLEAVGRGQGVLDDVVEQAGGDGDRVHLEVGQDGGDLERVHEVGLARVAHLPAVLEGREDVGPPEQLDVGVRIVFPDFFQQVLETDHGGRCLMTRGGVPTGDHRGRLRGGQGTAAPWRPGA